MKISPDENLAWWKISHDKNLAWWKILLGENLDWWKSRLMKSSLDEKSRLIKISHCKNFRLVKNLTCWKSRLMKNIAAWKPRREFHMLARSRLIDKISVARQDPANAKLSLDKITTRGTPRRIVRPLQLGGLQGLTVVPYTCTVRPSFATSLTVTPWPNLITRQYGRPVEQVLRARP